jgi:hypothetical protein
MAAAQPIHIALIQITPCGSFSTNGAAVRSIALRRMNSGW